MSKTITAHTFKFVTDSANGTISAGSLEEAYTIARSKITPEMINDGATLWVEDEAGNRFTMGTDCD